MNTFKLLGLALGFALVCNAGALAAFAGPNDFFGGGMSSGAIGSEPDDTPGDSAKKDAAQAAPAPTSSSPNFPSTDNTADEKKMQKKYKLNMVRLKDLIAKGEAMMKAAPNQSDKAYKKGRILKETGEKHLAEMQANSPYDLELLDSEKGDKSDKKKGKDAK